MQAELASRSPPSHASSKWSLFSSVSTLASLSEDSPLGAVNYPVFSKLYNTRVRTGQEMATIKTDLFPGAVWHNHNYSQLDAYMKEREVNASLTTAFDPTPERRAAGYPYEPPRTG